MYLTHGSLFSGIGGFDLAGEWMGWENLFHCEKNPFGREILKYYWPHAKSYEDIFTTDFTIWKGRVDVLTGGFPCQPFSVAGERKGTEDERHLWPEMLRAIRESEPAWVLPENVPGLLTISGGGWFSNKCALIWKMKGSKFGRFRFQLVPKAQTISGNESGFLLTPSVTMISERSEEALNRRKDYRNSTGITTVPAGNLAEQLSSLSKGGTLNNMFIPTPMQPGNGGSNGKKKMKEIMKFIPTPKSGNDMRQTKSSPSQLNGTHGKQLAGIIGDLNFLPTVTVMDSGGGDLEKIQDHREKVKAKGINGNGFGLSLREAIQMIPTPSASDHKGVGKNETVRDRMDYFIEKTPEGKKTGLKLQPAFAAWMMGFPEDWTELPFQSGEHNH